MIPVLAMLISKIMPSAYVNHSYSLPVYTLCTVLKNNFISPEPSGIQCIYQIRQKLLPANKSPEADEP